MLWPTLSVDNFFQNPDAVINFANSIKYKKEHGGYPGKRSLPLHIENNDFFLTSTRKIISLLYPNEINQGYLNWHATQYFQKVSPKEYNSSFVHQDLEEEFTSIVYLSDEEDAGTAIFKKIKEPVPDYQTKTKRDAYLDSKKQNKQFKKELKQNRDCYKQVFEFTSLKNRLVLFDSSQFHAVNNYGKENKDRLTLITFFKSIVRTDGQPLKFHVNECQKL
jgi:hypothetical protein